MNLINGLQKYDYVGSQNHLLLSSDAGKETGTNIGNNGENLTISFLSLNRSSLSMKLLESIEKHMPYYSGEVLIIDNGSDEKEISLLKSACKKFTFRTEIIELGKNYGVAGGRNRTIPHVKTEWVMCLDNDIFFISNPLKKIQKDIAVLGTHFLNLPLLEPDGKTIFAFGGHLYIDFSSGELHIGAGSAYEQKAITVSETPFLCTFLFGGASVFKKDTFEKLNGYDENMFVGFEDIDFSIRLFQSGFKVASTSTCALIHDHPAPSSKIDTDYEKERFSKQAIYDSAKYLERKHGFKVWNDAVGTWLDARHENLGIKEKNNISLEQSGQKNDAKTDNIDTKPCIALITDTDNWAFDNIANQIKKHLSYLYNFKIIPMDIIHNINHIFLLTEECDIVHFFWREHINLIGTPYYQSYIEQLGMTYKDFEKRFIFPKKITTSVYDHLLLSEKDISTRRKLYSSIVSGYTVSSKKLYNIYHNISLYPSPMIETPDGVDLTLFQPMNLKRLENDNKELIIGWVGNSQWASELEDFKGLHTILKPAIEELISEGLNIKTYFADKQERFIPHSEMPEYYSKIDIYICPSKIEGTPNPVLEAMACGVPIISTDVGIVPEVFGSKQKHFILSERNINTLKDKIKEIYFNRELLVLLSNENLEMIQEWDWSKKVQNFTIFFKKILEMDRVC